MQSVSPKYMKIHEKKDTYMSHCEHAPQKWCLDLGWPRVLYRILTDYLPAGTRYELNRRDPRYHCDTRIKQLMKALYWAVPNHSMVNVIHWQHQDMRNILEYVICDMLNVMRDFYSPEGLMLLQSGRLSSCRRSQQIVQLDYKTPSTECPGRCMTMYCARFVPMNQKSTHCQQCYQLKSMLPALAKRFTSSWNPLEEII